MAYDRGYAPTPLEQLVELALNRKKITIGLPAPVAGADHRFPLTPEAAGQLVGRGFVVKMEGGAARGIHYTDLRYQQHGVDIVDRAEAFRCDIVIYLSPLAPLQARMLRRGALLLSLFDSVCKDADMVRLLLQSHVITLALDLIQDPQGQRPFADILAEIAGRASIAMASSLLADADMGKGILLGGVAGIVPCEVAILGAGIDGCAAARSALGLGALVRMFDTDTYRLRTAIRELGPGVVGSAMHPRVVLNAFRSADVVIAAAIRPSHQISAEAVSEMKRGVVILDISNSAKPVFPSLRRSDLADGRTAIASEGERVCYVNPGSCVPRTAAMALSNSLLTMLAEIFTCDGLTNALMLNDGLQKAALTFLGKAVHPAMASLAGVRQVDIKLILQFS